MKTERPLIGIIPDYREGCKNGYSVRDYYALRANHVQTINDAGGAAVILTYDYNLIDSYLEYLDGVMVVGGYFDIDPNRYGENDVHPTVKLNKIRENFEHAFGEKAFKTDIPFLGICNGMQLLNISNGGSAIQHIPAAGDFMEHEQNNVEGFKDYRTGYHDVHIDKDSKLFGIVGEEKILTNSSHHQATKNVANGLKISARAPDGIIEAIEDPNHPFRIGVQWHPEFEVSEADQKIFAAFIEAAKEHAGK